MIVLAKPMLGIEEKILVSEVLSCGKLAHNTRSPGINRTGG